MKQALQNISVNILGALIFMIFALYNGFPIMSGDSAAYIQSGFEMFVPAERPIFYGLFIKATSLRASIWGTVFAQCLFTSYLCIRTIRQLIPGIHVKHTIALLLLVSLGSTCSWYCAQIMPDIFTPILFLSAYLYIFADNSRSQKTILVVIIAISILIHNSHYVIATAFALVALTMSLVNKQRWAYIHKKTLHVLLISIGCWASLFASNYLAGNGLTTGKASHVYLMGRLAESGVLKTYLEKACPEKNYTICQYKDGLPPVAWEFVWNTQTSPVYKAGGVDAVRQEYNTIIKDIISRPKYWPFLAYKSIEATLRQVISLNIDEAEELPWNKFDSEHPVYKCIEKYFPHEINEFIVSKQYYKTLEISFYDHVFVVVFLLSSIISLFCLSRDENAWMRNVYMFAILFIVLNAFVTASVANVSTRLNSRDIWLLPMVNFISIYRYISARFSVRRIL